MRALRSSIFVAMSSLLVACGPGGASFTRVEMTTAANGLFGSSKTDVWGTVLNGSTTTLAHSSTLKSWSAVSLAPEGSTTEPFLRSMATAGTNLAWVITSDSTDARKLLKVSSKGVTDDHTDELPTGVVADSLRTNDKGDALWVVGVSGSGQAMRAHLYARTGGALVEQTALPEALQVTVLAVASADEAWVWLYAPLGGAPKPRVFRVKGGVFTDAAWPSDSAPEIAIGPNETWLWLRGGPDGSKGQRFDGSTFTAWQTQGWPMATAQANVSYYAFAPFAPTAGKLTLLTHATDFSQMKPTERDSLRVVTIDPSGQVTVGATLATCLSPEECAAGSAQLLSDGTILVPPAEGSIIYSGDLSALR